MVAETEFRSSVDTENRFRRQPYLIPQGLRVVEAPRSAIQARHPFIQGLPMEASKVLTYDFPPQGKTEGFLKRLWRAVRTYRQLDRFGKVYGEVFGKGSGGGFGVAFGEDLGEKFRDKAFGEAFRVAIGEEAFSDLNDHEGWYSVLENLNPIGQYESIGSVYPEAPGPSLDWQTLDKDIRDIPGAPEYEGYEFVGKVIQLNNEPRELSEARSHILEQVIQEAMWRRYISEISVPAASQIVSIRAKKLKTGMALSEATKNQAVVKNDNGILFPAVVFDLVTYEIDGVRKTALFPFKRKGNEDYVEAINVVLDKANNIFVGDKNEGSKGIGLRSISRYVPVSSSSSVTNSLREAA